MEIAVLSSSWPLFLGSRREPAGTPPASNIINREGSQHGAGQYRIGIIVQIGVAGRRQDVQILDAFHLERRGETTTDSPQAVEVVVG